MIWQFIQHFSSVTANDLSAGHVCVLGISNREGLQDDRRLYLVSAVLIRLIKYLGAVPCTHLNTNVRTLNIILALTESQWRCCRTSIIG